MKKYLNKFYSKNIIIKILTTQGEKMRKIYTNGNIYTVTNGNAEAFVEEEGKFIYVGNNEDALSYKQEDSEIIDLQNKFVTAGFNDSHMHFQIDMI